ncbi:MAG: hypothetical protein JO219_06950 [Candidatus Eremiobacteraeota bacterium]|nr:hypothetical protein [Candidatus Eremiobacteraeota bacterium]
MYQWTPQLARLNVYYPTMVVAVFGVRMMQVRIHKIVMMFAVRHGFMSAT